MPAGHLRGRDSVLKAGQYLGDLRGEHRNMFVFSERSRRFNLSSHRITTQSDLFLSFHRNIFSSSDLARIGKILSRNEPSLLLIRWSFAEDTSASWKSYLISNQDPIPQVRHLFLQERERAIAKEKRTFCCRVEPIPHRGTM